MNRKPLWPLYLYLTSLFSYLIPGVTTVARFFFTIICTVPSQNLQVKFNEGFLRSLNLRQKDREEKLFILSHSMRVLWVWHMAICMKQNYYLPSSANLMYYLEFHKLCIIVLKFINCFCYQGNSVVIYIVLLTEKSGSSEREHWWPAFQIWFTNEFFLVWALL